MDVQPDPHNEESQELSVAPPPEPVVNKVPAALLLLAVVVWAALSVLLRDVWHLSDTVVRLVWGVLVAALGFSVLPMLRALIDPAAGRVRRFLVAAATVLFLLPLALGLVWLVHDITHPVPVRGRNQLPALPELVGQSRHDAERILGAAVQTGEYRTGSGPASVLGGIGANRSVGYALPDLNRLDRRPSKRAELQGDSRQTISFLRSLSLGQQDSDAHVIVYYSANGRVVGALLEVSRMATADLLSDVSTETVQRAVGFSDGTRASAGTALVGGQSVDYYTRLDPLPALPDADSGDVSVFVAAPSAATSALAARAVAAARSVERAAGSGVASDTDSAPDPSAVAPKGRSSHSDERFWVILCTDGVAEQDAVQEAARLNTIAARKNPEDPAPYSVERSGHLQFVNAADCWYVISDVAYGDEGKAQAAIWQLGMPLALEARAVQVTKVCGDPTIARVVR